MKNQMIDAETMKEHGVPERLIRKYFDDLPKGSSIPLDSTIGDLTYQKVVRMSKENPMSNRSRFIFVLNCAKQIAHRVSERIYLDLIYHAESIDLKKFTSINVAKLRNEGYAAKEHMERTPYNNDELNAILIVLSLYEIVRPLKTDILIDVVCSVADWMGRVGYKKEAENFLKDLLNGEYDTQC